MIINYLHRYELPKDATADYEFYEGQRLLAPWSYVAGKTIALKFTDRLNGSAQKVHDHFLRFLAGVFLVCIFPITLILVFAGLSKLSKSRTYHHLAHLKEIPPSPKPPRTPNLRPRSPPLIPSRSSSPPPQALPLPPLPILLSLSAEKRASSESQDTPVGPRTEGAPDTPAEIETSADPNKNKTPELRPETVPSEAGTTTDKHPDTTKTGTESSDTTTAPSDTETDKDKNSPESKSWLQSAYNSPSAKRARKIGGTAVLILSGIVATRKLFGI